MRQRRIAILIDGAFFLKRLPHLVAPQYCKTPQAVANSMRHMCRNHVTRLSGLAANDHAQQQGEQWRQFLYRIFFYDAAPYEGKKHHPLLNRTIDFAKSDVRQFRIALFDALRKERNVALRLGKVVEDRDWSLPDRQAKRLLATKAWITGIDFSPAQSGLTLTEAQANEARRLQRLWDEVESFHLTPGLRQKGVDMRIGLDIASITLKQQADTIILVAGDSDFVPAAKLARREGMEFILDPLWQKVNDDLFEHIDGLRSGLARPKPDATPGTDFGDAAPDTEGKEQ